MADVEEKWLVSAAMFQWLADIFYQPPTVEKLEFVKQGIAEWPILTRDLSAHLDLIKAGIVDGHDVISKDFHRLFIGPGKKEVYPWGSTYTDKEGLLFGATTSAWEKMCKKYNINIQPECNEPTDHFALIFSALAAIMASEYSESEKSKIVKEILSIHLSPWGEEVLTTIKHKAQTDYYKGFAMISQDLLNHWSQREKLGINELI